MAKRVINLSFQRTGTQSFHKFAGLKSFSSRHGLSKEEYWHLSKISLEEASKEFCSMAYHVEAISDSPLPLFLTDVVSQFQDEKFVLFYRSPESWAESVEKNIKVFYSLSGLYSSFDRLMYEMYSGKSKKIKDMTHLDFVNVYRNYLSYSRDLSQKMGLDLTEIELGASNSSNILNHVFDSIRKTNYALFPNEDYIRNIPNSLFAKDLSKNP